MARYDAMAWSAEDRDEFLAELKEDDTITNIKTIKTGEGWLIEWTEN